MDSGDWEQNSDEEREYRKAINNIRAKEMGFTEGEYEKFLNLIEKLEQALAKEPVYKWKSIYDTLEYMKYSRSNNTVYVYSYLSNKKTYILTASKKTYFFFTKL